MATKRAPKLDARLTAAASLVKPNGIVADVGCDHGKLSAYLACQDTCSRVIAADLRPGPLSVAKATCEEAGCLHKVEFRLGDGLQVVQPGEVDSIVLAGMSAQTIIEILQQAPWVKEYATRLVFVPATKPEVLRQWLWEQGFSLLEERVAKAAGRWYAIFSAEYTGVPYVPTPMECLLGRSAQGPEMQEYRAQVAGRLAKIRKGLDQDPQAAAQVDELLKQLQE